MILSAAGQALAVGGGLGGAGDLLRGQVEEESDELRKKRQREQQEGFSPAGQALFSFGPIGVPGAVY
jgi:hypothetical protein